MLELRPDHALQHLLHAAGLARSTYHYQVRRLSAPDPDNALKMLIQKVCAIHRGLYGYRRVTLAIRNDGTLVNHKKVQRLMNELGIQSKARAKKYRSYKGEMGEAAPNILNREFQALNPNEKWVTDVTEFRISGKKLYLSPVMDLYNGEIVAYETSHRPNFSLVMNMLGKAAKRLRITTKPLLHSDQGWHYRMKPYQAALAQHGVKQSMSRKGNCLDNAAMESFFATLKTEYFYLRDFEDVEELRAGLIDYIRYYNEDRIKVKLGGLSPVQYRERALTH